MLKTQPRISFGFFKKKPLFSKFEQLNSNSRLSAGVYCTMSSAMNQAGTNDAYKYQWSFFHTIIFIIPLFITDLKYFINLKFVIRPLLIYRITSK